MITSGLPSVLSLKSLVALSLSRSRPAFLSFKDSMTVLFCVISAFKLDIRVRLILGGGDGNAHVATEPQRTAHGRDFVKVGEEN